MSSNKNLSVFDELRHLFLYGNMVTRLILVNCAVFCLFAIARLLFWGFQVPDIYEYIENKLMLPADWQTLVWQPWSLFTYMFLHATIWHIFFNMISLNIFGNILYDFLGNRKILPLFLIGGVAGGVLYLLTSRLLHISTDFQSDYYLLGASAGVMAIMLAAATLRPDYMVNLVFIGPVKIKWIALVFIAIDLFLMPTQNTGGHVAHIGGAVSGFLFIRQLYAGNDWSLVINRWLDAVVNTFKRRKTKGPRVAHHTADKGEKVAAHQQVGTKNRIGQNKATLSDSKTEKQAQIDAILDKISKSGYDSLTHEEKEFLFKVSSED